MPQLKSKLRKQSKPKRRQSQQEGDERSVQILVHDSKRRREEDSQQSDTLRNFRSLRSLVHLTSYIAPCLEGLVGRLVREELELKLGRQIGIARSKRMQLVFNKELPEKLFTNCKIKAKDKSPIEVVLLDSESKCIVGAGSGSRMMRIKICVLNGEFGSNGNEDWSGSEFDKEITRPRENKGQLLKGDTIITLENGIGYINNLEFTDNSRWTKTGRFRLGAKVLNPKDAINIREAITKPFPVKLSRGETNQKHDTPYLNDETWRLKHISKNGQLYLRLSKHGINTVEDLLMEHQTNPSSLQEKFGNISKNKREEIIKQAKKAKHAKTTFVAEATFAPQNYDSEKNTVTVNSHQREAYENLKDPVPIETKRHDSVKTLIQGTQCVVFPIGQDEILRPLASTNWSEGEQFVDAGASYFDDGNLLWVNDDDMSQNEQMANCSIPFPSNINRGKSKMI